MNKQQLASKIWESANKTRSKTEANEYKGYILGFIFYKFLSENEVARMRKADLEDLAKLSEDDPDTVDFVRQECGYFISYDNLFSTWLAKGKEFGVDDVRDAAKEEAGMRGMSFSAFVRACMIEELSRKGA